MPIVLAYHGCSLDVAERLLDGADFAQSARSYDWLGRGIYFWEEDPLRAHDWAMRRNHLRPSVVGAAVETGRCLDLTRQAGLRAVSTAYNFMAREYLLGRRSLPENSDAPTGIAGDLALRHLDRAVIDYLNELRDRQPERSFETVRALYPEGKPLYPGAGFRELTHVQLCVREPKQVMGVFRVPEHQRLRLGLPVLYPE